MLLSVRREFIFGLLSILIIFIPIYFYINQYKQQGLNLAPLTNNVSAGSSTILSNSEILKHNISSDCWLIIENKVYDATNFLSRHPGGSGLITPYCGKDATQPFLTKDGRGSHSAEAFRILGLIYIGDLNGKVIKQPDNNAVKSLQIGENEQNDD